MRSPSPNVGRLAFRSVEFSSRLPFADLARCPCRPTHYVLPDLPDVVTDRVRDDFHQRTSHSQSSKAITTIAASLHDNSASLINAARERLARGSTTLLLVGGNSMNDKSITTPEALTILQDSFPADAFEYFCTWDVNSESDFDHLLKKLEAGATGVITQPPLTSVGWNQLDSYCSNNVESIQLIPGVALPKSSKQLLFWSSLLKQQDNAREDKLFRSHLDYYNDPTFDKHSRQAWAMEQRDRLLSYDSIFGLHFMPLGNDFDLMAVLS